MTHLLRGVFPLTVSASFILFGCASALSQSSDAATNVGPKIHIAGPMDFHPGMGFGEFELMGGFGKVIQNKPYTATAVTQTTQMLADGNQIVRTNQTSFYRDSAGRTRREQTIGTLGASSPAVSKQVVSISDPVAKVGYVLNPEKKTGRKIPIFGHKGFGPDDRHGLTSSVTGARLHDEGKPFPHRDEKGVTKEELGTQTIAGVVCTGTRTTKTIPAGEIGNEKPLVSVREVWYSSDIDAIVQAKTSDPRFGTTTYTLSNVKVGEPTAALFAPPADYKIETPVGRMGHGGTTLTNGSAAETSKPQD